MDAIFRAIFIYLFLLIVLRLSGKRTLSKITTFDLVLLLIIGETTQQALLGDDYSLTNAAVVILALVSFDIILSYLKRRTPSLGTWAEGAPLVIMHNGKLLKKRMERERIDESDILEAARSTHGLERLNQIRYAVLEKSGGITIVPKSNDRSK